MNEDEFLRRLVPRFGQSVLGLLGDASREALIDVCVEKGLFTRDEIKTAREAQLKKIAESLEKMPTPSPIQLKRKDGNGE